MDSILGVEGRGCLGTEAGYRKSSVLARLVFTAWHASRGQALPGAR